MNKPLPRVGFVGLGAMGMPMAKSLLRAGLTVTAYDVRAEAINEFTAAGGQGVATLGKVSADADVLVLAVVNAAQVESVLFGQGNAAAAMQPGGVVVVCSTVGPDFARTTGTRLAEAGLLMLDAPMSGGTLRAADGSLSIMAAGPDAAFAKAQPVLDALAANVYRMGAEHGLGSMMKLVNQLMAGSHIAVACEAMAYGARAGLDPAKIYEVICNSAGNSFMFENRVPHMLAGDYTPHSAVDIWVKDLGIVLGAGKDLHFPLFFSALAHQLFMSASAAGHGRLDDAAVVKVFEGLTGISIKPEA
ncbi:MAG: NAD-binding protein [Caldilineaceae bacterium]|nr:NAD-binding protein [Caldilineaceae bacterium]